ncbi:zf-CCHC domain-containing protein [Tanacetum coccineum]
MITLAEFMIVVGADNRPPMLDKPMYESRKSRMELYIQEDDTVRLKTYEGLSDKEKLQADSDLKATNIVLQGLSPDVYSLVNHHKVSKEIWDRVKLLMQGTSLSKQEREYKLYDEFDKLSHVKGEALYGYYLRFAQLINDMNIIHMTLQPVQVNTMFLNSFPPDWGLAVPTFLPGIKPLFKMVESPFSKFKEDKVRMLSVQDHKGMLQAEGKELDEEQLAFLADPGVADGQVTQTITRNAAFLDSMELKAMTPTKMDISHQRDFLCHLSSKSVIVDDYSRFTLVKFLRSKDEVPEFMIKLLKMIQVRLNATVRNIRTDNGKEFVNQTLKAYYKDIRISHQTSVARTPQQNVIVKRRNRALVEAARAMLIFSKALLFLWEEAIATACNTQNRSLIRKCHNKTPYELLHNKKPDLSYLYVFGALCYPTNDSDNLGKLQPKANIGIFIGYAPAKNAFLTYKKRTRLVPNPPSSTSYVPPTKNDWDILFQPTFDELLNPPPSVVSPVPAIVAQRPTDPTGSSVSTLIDQDAPSSSNPSTQEHEQSLIISQGVKESPKTPHFYVEIHSMETLIKTRLLKDRRLNRFIDSDKYLEGQSMQRPPLFESGHFIYWKNRFETYVKEKDLDLWHIILNGDSPPLAKNEVTQILKDFPFEEQSDDLKKKLAKNNEAKMVLYNALPKKKYERIFICKTAKDIWQSLLITHQGNSQVKDNKIDLLVQQYEQFTILEEESIDSGFFRFNIVITSLKALDKGFSSKNYVRKFLRALHPKWKAKVTAIEESKDLSSPALDELIGNLKKESIEDETSTSESDDEEYVMTVRNFKKFFRRKGKFVWQPREEKNSFQQRDEKKGKSDQKCFRCGDPNHLIGDCLKPSRNKDQKAFIGGSWSDSENDAEDKTNDETCLMAQSSNEVTLNSSSYSDNAYSLDNDNMQIDYDSLCEISLKIINKNN